MGGLWFLAETLEQKDKHSPIPSGRQVHLVGRVQDESHVRLFREYLERALEDAHQRITDRTEKRRKKSAAAANGEKPKEKRAEKPDAAADGASPFEIAAAAAAASAPPAATNGATAPAAWSTPGNSA